MVPHSHSYYIINRNRAKEIANAQPQLRRREREYLRVCLDERKMGEERKWEERKQGGRKTGKKM